MIRRIKQREQVSSIPGFINKNDATRIFKKCTSNDIPELNMELSRDSGSDLQYFPASPRSKEVPQT
jgi:hypothetical protein